MTAQSAVRRIPVCEPYLNGREMEYVNDAIKTTWISSAGKYLKTFETNFAQYVGVKHGIATVNGTTALHLALVAAGIKCGDEVLLPDFTMMASALAICYTGAKPVFVDADPETWNMDPAQIESHITPKTRAIMVVHIYGHPSDMDPIQAIAKKHNLKIIEDAAEVHGAEYHGKKCGSMSDVAAFSFYANKVITTGEGGMVVTNNDTIADQSRYFKNLCFPLNGPRNYHHEDLGFNYRMSNVQAAIGCAQLEKIEEYVNARRQHAARYNDQLKGSPFLQLPVERPGVKNCYWMYGVVLTPNAKVSRETVMQKLSALGIETRAFFEPMHRQPALKKYGAECGGSYPVSDRLGTHGFYLPSGSQLPDQDIDFVSESLLKCFP